MALSGLEIFKLLPKTNCKECGFPTCLAFAMKLAQKGTELSNCPYVSDEAKAALEAASQPPIRLITVGAGDKAFEIGNEVAMFRHEKTFFHPCGIVVRVGSDGDVAGVAAQVAGYSVERVGMTFGLNGLAIEDTGGDFAAAAAAARSAASGLPLVLLSADAAKLDAALSAGVAADKPLIGPATAANCDAMAEVAKKHGVALIVKGEDGDIQKLTDVAEKAAAAGVEDLVLDPATSDVAADLAAFTQLRRLALKKNFRPLGFPIFANAGGGTPVEQAVRATTAVAKYGGVVMIDTFDKALVTTLVTLRLNIYTDPQKPIQMEPKLYQVGTPDADSPLFVTTNFSLTYFTVSGEIEASGVPVWLLVADADGMSVLTAWAAGKFDAEKIAKSVNISGVGDKLSHKSIVLPGFVAGLSGEVEEELPGWKIMVGPREAVEVPNYLKNVWKAD
jgi:acetyl-CoA decarbonylase/synthase, CODH/ACS complex subunit gamma